LRNRRILNGLQNNVGELAEVRFQTRRFEAAGVEHLEIDLVPIRVVNGWRSGNHFAPRRQFFLQTEKFLVEAFYFKAGRN
jgi:hypothetical protein